VDLGWCAVRTHAWWRVGNSRQGLWSLGWETMGKVYGVAMVRPQGYSRVPNLSTGQQW